MTTTASRKLITLLNSCTEDQTYLEKVVIDKIKKTQSYMYLCEQEEISSGLLDLDNKNINQLYAFYSELESLQNVLYNFREYRRHYNKGLIPLTDEGENLLQQLQLMNNIINAGDLQSAFMEAKRSNALLRNFIQLANSDYPFHYVLDNEIETVKKTLHTSINRQLNYLYPRCPFYQIYEVIKGRNIENINSLKDIEKELKELPMSHSMIENLTGTTLEYLATSQFTCYNALESLVDNKKLFISEERHKTLNQVFTEDFYSIPEENYVNTVRQLINKRMEAGRCTKCGGKIFFQSSNSYRCFKHKN
ncbi:hypothetical protein MM300_07330 [Evansella sp. LMS18]|uniref:hypothetical protein n=1 Tax=Evansella sp. LMS18 TaxID=2924033 RepID=UPI0020D1E764|nr:hypothetical protein [Evansella sp. LMS18]UTR12096.1 hypothetical protein MM300_07330 [Evansella sp. LMS18]